MKCIIKFIYIKLIEKYGIGLISDVIAKIYFLFVDFEDFLV